jgi:hypothetical protein
VFREKVKRTAGNRGSCEMEDADIRFDDDNEI